MDEKSRRAFRRDLSDLYANAFSVLSKEMGFAESLIRRAIKWAKINAFGHRQIEYQNNRDIK